MNGSITYHAQEGAGNDVSGEIGGKVEVSPFAELGENIKVGGKASNEFTIAPEFALKDAEGSFFIEITVGSFEYTFEWPDDPTRKEKQPLTPLGSVHRRRSLVLLLRRSD